MSVSEVGRRLKKARLDAGLTQADVAKALGVTPQAVSSYERGINRVDTDTLKTLCALYGIKITDMLRTPEWTDEMKDAYNRADTTEQKQHYLALWGTPDFLIEESNNRREPERIALSAEDEALLYAYHHASDDDRQIIDNIVRRYVSVAETQGEKQNPAAV